MRICRVFAKFNRVLTGSCATNHNPLLLEPPVPASLKKT